MTPGLDPLNIILLAIALVVFWRLKSVLGTRTGTEKPPLDPFPRPVPRNAENNDNVIPLPNASRPQEPVPSAEPWKGFAPENSPVAEGLSAIAKASREFSVASFLEGAKVAYEMVLQSYAEGDKKSLRNLLSKEVLETFEASIDDRARQQYKPVFRFVGMKSASIDAAGLDGQQAQISIRFRSEQINGLLDKDGKIIEGHDKAIDDIEDVWTFERDVTARDPNWKLVSTDEAGA